MRDRRTRKIRKQLRIGMLGFYVWAIIIIVIAACIAPWWFLPVIIILSLASFLIFGDKY